MVKMEPNLNSVDQIDTQNVCMSLLIRKIPLMPPYCGNQWLLMKSVMPTN